MNAQIDHVATDRRYTTQTRYDGGFTLLDRLNGQLTGEFSTRDEAVAEAARLNSPRGLPA